MTPTRSEVTASGRSRPAGRRLLGLFLVAGLVAATGLLHAGVARAGSGALHITLDATRPAADSTVVGPVSEVRLIFSGPPLLRGASVRVVNSARSLVRSSPPTHDPADLKEVFVRIDPPLPAGAFVVQWRVIADDGHVMRDDFSFEVVQE